MGTYYPFANVGGTIIHSPYVQATPTIVPEDVVEHPASQLAWTQFVGRTAKYNVIKGDPLSLQNYNVLNNQAFSFKTTPVLEDIFYLETSMNRHP